MKQLLIWFLGILLLSSCGIFKKGKSHDKPPFDAAYIQAFHEAVRMKTVGQVDQAIAGFDKCLTLRQDDDAVYYALSQLYLQKNNKPKSSECIQLAAKIDPDNIWYTQELAYMDFETGNYSEAIKNFEKLVKHEPRNVEWLYGYAESLVRAGKTSEAIRAYDKMEDQIGKHPELAIQKFKLYVQLKQDEKAIAEINAARKEFPQDSQLIATLVDYYFQKGKEETAVQMLQELVLADPENGRAHLALADIYRQKGDQKTAYIHLKKAFICQDVTVDNKMQILINILETSFKIDPEVFELLELMITVHPEEAKAHSIRGDYMLKIENDAEALKSYKQALKYDKSLFPIWNQVLIMEYQNNSFDDLYADSKECLTYFTTMPTVFLLYGLSSVQLGKYDEALTALESGIELVVNDKGMEAEFNAQIGDAHFGLKQIEEGKIAYEKAIKQDPRSSLIKNNFAYKLALHKTDLDKALDLIEQALASNAEAPQFNDTKGFVLFQKGNYAEAKVFIEKAYSLKPSDKIIVEHLGDVLFKLGEKDRALTLWIKAREMGSSNKILDKKIEKKEYYDPIY